jgi:hydroxyethylthiazole kinase-like sugar kinase family protein
MDYVHLYTGPDGLSYFKDVEVPLASRGQGTELSELFAAKGMVMRRNTSAYELDYHVAPRKQFVVNLTGTVEIVASGGETRQFGPGSIMLADDLTGKGHISKALTPERLSLFVHLD